MRALLLALACAAAAGARYGDYSGVKMPQYAAEDYDPPRDIQPPTEHTWDRKSEPLDYDDDRGDEDDVHMNNDDRNWRRDTPKQTRSKAGVKRTEGHAAYTDDVDDVDSRKPNFKHAKRRPRLGNWESETKSDSHRARGVKRSRIDNPDVSIDDDLDSDIGLHDSKDTIDFDDVKNNYERLRESTERVRRRKPRDREMKPMMKTINKRLESDDDLEREIFKEQIKINPLVEEAAPSGQKWHRNDQRKTKVTEKELFDNHDYFDMKRVKSIKLPAVVQRTNWAEERTPMVQLLVAPEEDLKGEEENKETDAIDEDPKEEETQEETTKTTSSTTTITRTTYLTTKAPVNVSKELSLAEKSRLSILKKAERKEGAHHSTAALKPPVLLQVTEKMATVVMVEPPRRSNPWMRAADVAEDTPDTIRKVKRLMREKLLAESKNIHELTDNWDELVCDYVDTALLSDMTAAANVNIAATYLHILTFLALLIYIY